MRAHVLLCIALAIAVGACRRGERPPVPAAEEATGRSARARLVPVAEPDASKAAASVRDRIRAQYASLILRRDAGDTSDAELGAAYGEVGKLLLSAEYLVEAEPFFTNARTLMPGEMRWPYYLGQLHRLRQQPEQAIAMLEESLELRPDYAPGLIALGNLYLDQSRPEKAADVFQRAVTIEPRSAAALYGLGRASLARRDFANAVTQLEAALAADPDAVAVHYPLAMAYRGRGETARADSHLREWKDREVRAPDPLMADVGELLQTAIDFEIRGTAALDRRSYKEAAAEFRKGLATAPNDAPLHLNLGTALYLAGDRDGAAKEFEQALRLSPGLAKAHFTLAVLSEDRGNDVVALDHFAAAVKADPTLADARFGLANALRRAGQVDAALPHYEEIIRADPGASQARLGYALALVQANRFREARDTLANAAKAFPDQIGFAHALARVLAAAPDDGVRDGAAALRIMQDLIKVGRGAAAEETMAMALAEVGRYRDAAQWQRDAIASARREQHAALATQMADNLRLYESNMPCRAPWRKDDAVFRPRAGGIRR